MKIVIVILSLFVFLKTLYYGIYEFKQKNKTAGVSIVVLSVIALVVPIVITFFRVNLAN